MALGSNKQKLVIEGENKTKRAFGGIMRSMRNMGDQARRMGRTLGVAFGAATAALSVMVTKTIESQDRIGKLAQQIGVSTEALSELQFAAEQTGAGADKLSAGLEVMSKRLGEVKTKGTGAAKDAIDALGLSVDDLVKMKPDEAFVTIAEAMEGMSTQSERNAAAANIFSRANQSLVNTLALGGEGMDEMRQKARELGRSLSRDQTDAAADAADAVNELKSAFTGMANTITTTLAPTITLAARMFTQTLTRSMNDTMDSQDDFQNNTFRMGDRILEAMAIVTDTFRTSFNVISGGFQAIGKTLGAGGAQIVALFTGNFDQIKAIGEAWSEDMNILFDDTVTNFDTSRIRDQLAALQAEMADETAFRRYTNAVDDMVASNTDLFGSQAAVIESAEEVAEAITDGKTAIEKYAESSMAAKIEVQRAVSQMEALWKRLEQNMPFFGKKTEEQKENVESLWRTTDEIARDTIRGVRDAWVGAWESAFRGNITSAKDFFKALKDIAIRTAAEIAAAWSFTKLFGGEFKLGSISFGGDGAGGLVGLGGLKEIGSKISAGASKLFGGATTTSGAGQAAAAGIPGSSVVGTSPTAMGGVATMGPWASAAAGAAILFAQREIIQAIRGASSRDKALKDLQRAGPGVAAGLGLQATAGDKFGFGLGANAGFAAEFAKGQIGNRAGTAGDGLAVFKGMDLEGTVQLLDEAQEKFEALKRSAASTFSLGRQGAMRVGRALQDGFIDKVELADMGFIALGERIENTKSGVVKMGELSIEQFEAVMEAVDKNILRLEALRGETNLNAREMQFFRDQGLMAAGQVQAGFEIAGGAIRSFGQQSAAALLEIEGAARAAGGAVAGIGGEGPVGAASRDNDVVTAVNNQTREIRRQNQANRFTERGGGGL